MVELVGGLGRDEHRPARPLQRQVPRRAGQRDAPDHPARGGVHEREPVGRAQPDGGEPRLGVRHDPLGTVAHGHDPAGGRDVQRGRPGGLGRRRQLPRPGRPARRDRDRRDQRRPRAGPGRAAAGHGARMPAAPRAAAPTRGAGTPPTAPSPLGAPAAPGRTPPAAPGRTPPTAAPRPVTAAAASRGTPPAARGLRRLVPWAVAGVAVAWIALGLVLDARGTVLGTPLPPFNVAWQPRLAEPAWLAATVVLFALAVVLAPRVLAARIHPLAFAAGLLAFTLALRLALAAARAGTQVYDRVFDYTRNGYAKNEYLGALDALTYGTGYLLDRFAELVPALPVHAAGHPPGILLAIAWLDLDTPGRLAAACIAAGALAVPLTYAIGRELLAERDARAAALLMALAPGGLIFATTSADALYLGLGALAAWPLAARGLAARALGAVALAVGTLFAWSLLAVGAWAA